MVYYLTEYTHPSTKKTETYSTRTLTPFHEQIRAKYGGRTLRCDPSIPWPFGVYAEIVATTPKP